MGDEETIGNILSLSNVVVPTECSTFRGPLDSETYCDLLAPFTTPPNKYVSLDLITAPDESLEKQDVNDSLLLPEGSPVTPQLPESSTFPSEIHIESQDHASLFEPRILRDQRNQGNHCQEQNLIISKAHNRTNQQHTGQVRHNMETDLQELLDLGKAMSLPSGSDIGMSTFYPGESRGIQVKQNGNSDNIALFPFPLDELFTPPTTSETVSEQTVANHNVFSLAPNMAQSCPDSSTVLSTEVGSRLQTDISKHHSNPISTSIDEVLLKVARKNYRRRKPDMIVTSAQSDELTSEVTRKKRKVSSTTIESRGEGDGCSRTMRSTGQRKKAFKKGQGNCQANVEKTGKVQTSLGSAPSRFCHICTRAAKPDVILVCANVARGTCRKIICFKCIRDMSWDWGSLQENEEWTCTHCREDCPAKAQCNTYRRVNQNRRADGRRSRKMATASAKPGERNDGGSSE